MRSSSRRWNAFVTHSRALNSRRTSYPVSRQQPSRSSPDAMQLSLRVQPTEWTQRLQRWSTQSTPEVVGAADHPEAGHALAGAGRSEQVHGGAAFDPWYALVEHRPLGDMMRE